MTEIHIFDEKTSAAVRTLLDEIDQQRARAEAAEAERDDYCEARDVLRHQLDAVLTIAARSHLWSADGHWPDCPGCLIAKAVAAPSPVLGSSRRAQGQPTQAAVVDQAVIEALIANVARSLASAGDDAERAEAIEMLLDGWYAAWPDSAVTDPHAPLAAELVRLLGSPAAGTPTARLIAAAIAWRHLDGIEPLLNQELAAAVDAYEQAPVSSVIAVPSRYARAAGAPHAQNASRDWVRLRTGSGRLYEGHRAASCPGDGVAGHVHDVRCVDRAEG